jgi:hypothetical protein
MANRHRWINGKVEDTFVKDRSDKNTCSICGLKRKMIFQRGPGAFNYYIYYSFNIRETKLRPDCLDGNKSQIKLF